MKRVLVRLTLPDLEITLRADDPARWVAVFDGAVMVGLAEFIAEADLLRAHLFLPMTADASALRVEVAEHPAALAN